MKSLRPLLLTLVLATATLLTACSADDTPAPVPPYQPGQVAQLIELALADFDANPHITREVELVRPGSLIVSLETGTSPGMAWADPAEISSPVIAEVSHALTTPVTGTVAAAAGPVRDVWVFDSVESGNGLVRFVYGPPGQDGGAHWTLTVYITVK